MSTSFRWPVSSGSGGGAGVTVYPSFGLLPGTATIGTLAVTADTLILYIYNGSAWIAESTPGSDLTSLNSDVTTAQTLSTGTAGTDFAIVDNGTGDHKFNLPVASASNTGKLSKDDWATFNAKVSSQWLQNGADIHYDAGKVGVGIASPISPIHVYGAGASISVEAADATRYAAYRIRGAGGSLLWGITSDYNFENVQTLAIKDEFNNAVRIFVDTTGFVGIGNITPATKLDVTGVVTATGFVGPLTGNASGTAANVTGTVAIGNGGTGQTTQQLAIDALAGAVTSAQYLRGNGTHVVMSGIQAADVPTLNQNTSGTAANITATSNGTLTTLSALSLPGSQVSGNISGNAANVTGIVAKANGGSGADNSSLNFPSSGTLATLAGAETFTNKLYTGGTASNTVGLVLPSGTTAGLNALTRVAGRIYYNTSTNAINYDNGSTLLALEGVTSTNFTSNSITPVGANDQRFRYTAGSSQVMTQIDNGAVTDGQHIWIMGTSDTNTCTINDSTTNVKVNGPWVGYLGSLIEFMYDSGLALYIEVSRNGI